MNPPGIVGDTVIQKPMSIANQPGSWTEISQNFSILHLRASLDSSFTWFICSDNETTMVATDVHQK